MRVHSLLLRLEIVHGAYFVVKLGVLCGLCESVVRIWTLSACPKVTIYYTMTLYPVSVSDVEFGVVEQNGDEVCCAGRTKDVRRIPEEFNRSFDCMCELPAADILNKCGNTHSGRVNISIS